MDWDFDQIPQSVRREPIKLRSDQVLDSVAAGLSLFVLVAFIAAMVALFFVAPARGRDLGQWINSDPETSAWYNRQKMPDYPSQSCCGEGDAYYADKVEVGADGTVYAIITDERPDEPLKRPHIPVGTKIPVPTFKNKDTRGDPNPTGHTVIFVRWYGEMFGHGNWGVLCFLSDGSM
jgi:hypothetical protein